jgi:hypothetical protein
MTGFPLRLLSTRALAACIDVTGAATERLVAGWGSTGIGETRRALRRGKYDTNLVDPPPFVFPSMLDCFQASRVCLARVFSFFSCLLHSRSRTSRLSGGCQLHRLTWPREPDASPPSSARRRSSRETGFAHRHHIGSLQVARLRSCATYPRGLGCLDY